MFLPHGLVNKFDSIPTKKLFIVQYNRVLILQKQLSHLPSALHFAIKEIPHQDGHVLTIPQREFYDIKAQLMAEDETLDFIPGISSEDLRANVYEGGYKTWECAEDLTAYLLCNEALVKDLRNGATIIEVRKFFVRDV